MSTRLFTPEQLDLYATPLSIQLERAARRGDREDVARIADEMDVETLAIYDAYVSWIGVLQRYVVAHGGERAHERALRQVGEYAARPFLARLQGADLRRRVVVLAQRLRSSGSTFRVEETDEAVRFVADPWGPVRWWRHPRPWQADAPRRLVDGRFQYPCYGYHDAPVSFPVLSGAHDDTQGRELPAVLTLEIQFLESVATEVLGRPLAVVGLGDDAEDAVTLDVHKHPGDIPADVVDRLGARLAPDPAPRPAGRLFTDDELVRLATPLPVQVRAAGAAADWSRLEAISTAMDEELVRAKDPHGVAIAAYLSWIAWHHGEQAVEDVLGETAEVVMAPFVDGVRGLAAQQSIPMWASVFRAHGSTFWIEEDDERVLFRGRPLGACHRMWSTAYQHDVERIAGNRVRYPTFGCYDGPAALYVMREPRAVTGSRADYPIYSCHCHALHEIYATKRLGHPLWVEIHPLEDRDGDTVHVHYKDPARWPAHYFEAVGLRAPE